MPDHYFSLRSRLTSLDSAWPMYCVAALSVFMVASLFVDLA